MNKKLISSLVAGLALSAAAVAPAQASILDALNGYSGTVKFNVITGADIGALYSGDCATQALCDAAQVGSVFNAIADEDSWGIFQVDKLLKGSTSTALWKDGDSGGAANDYIVGVFGGLKDQAATVSASGQQAFSSGGWMRLYNVSSLTTFNSYLASGLTDAQRDDTTGYIAGLESVGTLLVSAVFDGTASLLSVGDPYQSQYNGTTFELTGTGFMDVTGGTAQPFIKVGAQLDANGVGQDIGLSLKNDTGGDPPGGNWTTNFGGKATIYDIPEPGSIALVGLGLMGLAGLRRRKQQA